MHPPIPESTGLLPFEYQGETFETWYRVVGDLKAGHRPVVILHGGPAFPSVYLHAHDELYTSQGIPVVYYHQLGCGNSTHLPEKPKEFWTVELFIAELENVLPKLNVGDDFDLLGHSWGAMLATEYVAARQPAGLKRLVLANGPASMALYKACAAKLMASDRYPPGFLDAMRKHEEELTVASAEYQGGSYLYLQKHTCTVDPWPQELQAAFGELLKDPTVLRALFGDFILSCNGNLVGWSVEDKVAKIAYPTLVINGSEDTAQDECIAPFFHGIPKVRWVRYAKSSHMPWFEEREVYFRDLRDFLK
ncbi:proline-specific peptidase [Auriscalpium vulgare]|uniref:Proline-specific peptidase n=1 Tax=Auriscalpium vulgare TaxID=40419 RepID=A0ACB8RXE3_9AGAM|nr:proline-specific peptidase [Auriscalpium vulgare]